MTLRKRTREQVHESSNRSKESTTRDSRGNLINEAQYIITMWCEPNDVKGFPFKCLYAGTGIRAGRELHYHKLDEFGPDLNLLATKARNAPGRAFQVDGARTAQHCSQVDTTELTWPVEPIHQEKGKLCVQNALLNIGVGQDHLDAIGVDNLDSLRNVVDKLTKRPCFKFSINRIRHLSDVVPDIFACGRYVFSTIDGHCLSVIDGLFLDTDPQFPSPTRDLQSLGLRDIVTVYRFTSR